MSPDRKVETIWDYPARSLVGHRERSLCQLTAADEINNEKK